MGLSVSTRRCKSTKCTKTGVKWFNAPMIPQTPQLTPKNVQKQKQNGITFEFSSVAQNVSSPQKHAFCLFDVLSVLVVCFLSVSDLRYEHCSRIIFLLYLASFACHTHQWNCCPLRKPMATRRASRQWLRWRSRGCFWWECWWHFYSSQHRTRGTQSRTA